MMSNDQNLISDFATYFINLAAAIFKEQDSPHKKISEILPRISCQLVIIF